MKRLLQYGKGYGRQAVLAPLFKMLEASFELFVPLVVAAVIDTGIRRQDIGYILRMSGLLVLLAVIGLTCSITAQYFAAKTAVGFATRLRHALFAHIQSLDFSAQDKVGPATLITRMTSDVNQVQNGINMTLRLLLRSPFVVFGAMVMAFTIDWKAALIFAAAIPLLCLVVFGIMALTMPLYKKTQAELDGVTGITRENLTGVRVIRAFGREDAERSRFAAAAEALNGLQQKVGGISGLTKIEVSVLEAYKSALEQGKNARTVEFDSKEEQDAARNLFLLTAKPVLYVCNVDETSAKDGNEYTREIEALAAEEGAETMVIAAKTEEDIAELESYEDKQMFLEELGLEESGVNRLIKKAYSLLNLETFITAGEMEVKAWTYHKGWKAPQCAGVIHTDFEKGFIRAEVIKYDDYITYGSEAAVRDAGKMGIEGKDYVVQDGDIMHFRFNV